MALSRSMQAKVIGLAVAAAVGGFLFGFDSSVVNGAVDAIEGQFKLDPSLVGLAVASALLGCAVGAYIAGFISDKFGRKMTMVVGAVLFFASALGAGFAFGVWDLFAWRLVGGLGIGIASVVAPAYIAEISPKQIRDGLASTQQLAITVGIFAALLSDALFANSAGGAGAPSLFGLEAWRWMFLVGVIPAVVYGIIGFTLPESPRYLMQKGRRDEAKVVFDSLWPEEDVTKAINEIDNAIEQDEKAKRVSIVGGKFLLPPIVWIGILLSMFQQFVGINVIFYYSTTLWKSVGFGEENSFAISVFTSIVNVAVTVVAILLVDRVGRRPILLIGSIGMTVTLGVMALAFSTATGSGSNVVLGGAWGPVALVAANLFVVAFGMSWGPIVWVLLGEIFPNRIRAKALGIGAMAQWIANFLITVSFPSMSSWSLPITYGMYALFAFLSLIFVFFKIPETRGLSLEEAETLFTDRRTARAIAKAQR